MEIEHRRPFLLAGTALALILTAYSTLKPPRHSDSARETAIEIVIVLAVALVTFAILRRRLVSDTAAASGRLALVVATVGLLAVGVFWLGVFSVAIAGAAWLLAMEARRRRSHPAAATAALAVAALTVLLSIVVVIAS